MGDLIAMLSKLHRALYLCLLVFCPPSSFAQPELEDFEIHSMYETWRLPVDETMGVVGLGVSKSFGDYARLGIDFFDAIEGRRGGFITLGMSAALEYPVSDRWFVEAGLFLGAGSGSGGYELAGGGLMVRESVGLKYAMTNQDAASLGWSHVDFPEGGKIQSSQVYFSYQRAFQALFQVGKPIFASSDTRDAVWDDHEAGHQQPGLIVRHVHVPVSTKRLDGMPQRNLQQVGVEWKSYLGSHTFFRAETVGAMGGSSAGYMHLMAGLGTEYALSENMTAEASLNLGGGGGGGVDTGGGLLAEATLGVRRNIFDAWFMKAAVGHVTAPNGKFSGTTYSMGLGRDFGISSRRHHDSADPYRLDYHPIRMRATQQTYFGRGSGWRTRPDKNVSNLGVQVDYFISPNVFLTGQGLAAYAGDAGAYMTGLVGMGYRWVLTDRFFAEGEALAGAGGGGGLNVGSGLVNQLNIGIGYQLSDSVSLLGTIGEMRAVNGPFRATVAGVSLAYHFNLLSLQN
ncbi:MAG: hypothetical protein Q8O64_09120 [Sideroxyarcus sp.]|nr:hypothetical protein [Sideroxyarcus sp.]